MRAETSFGSVADVAVNQSFVVPLVTADGRPDTAENELFRFRFGPAQTAAPGEIGIALEPVFGPAEEVWVTRSPVERCSENGIGIAYCDEYFFASTETDIRGNADIADKSFELYQQLLESAIRHEYPHLIRAWNYVPMINEGSGDTERYRQFSIGRAKAFHAANFSSETFPAGTAIGVRNGSRLQVVLLAGRQPAKMLENPRQTSAYKYPRRYGPVAPSFARASQICNAQTRQLWISGTASIVGSESCHAGDTSQQLEETLQNIGELAASADCRNTDSPVPVAPLFRVYLREDADHAHICTRIRDEFGEHAGIVLLRGDICRSELLIEIECIFWSE